VLHPPDGSGIAIKNPWSPVQMKVYHRTNAASAASIRAEGFRDASDHYLTEGVWTGVWVSDRDHMPEHGSVLLAINVPDPVLTKYEWVQEGLGYREFLIPAAILNQFGPPTRADTDETQAR
jgi:hypothetical protein